ncbi:ABC transporter [Caulobacter sp. CCUG 60055]|uniref:ABC transporter ATP-binding protein n=1 Tax=Caulobacter sp. CCUG 60055 TaxID=2100090 RepID=UPI001FA75B2C|nr:ABC transporter ATP-binding protein [Caulobacteraceae bacterium]MCI3180518.1 ABC transporter [Caulobacter sp. CCUG 60055]
MSGLKAAGLRLGLNGRAILGGVDVSFARGEVSAVIGPNGAGKSTLLACLAGLRRPDDGTVDLDDADIRRLSPRARARRMGFLPQTPEIAWSVDVETLVGLGRTPFVGALGLGAADREAVARALAATDMTGMSQRVVTTLSGGERARALIARALAGEPDWLLADEPMTGLDPGHQLDAADLFRKMAADGRGVVVTLHDLSLAARVADKIVVLAGGRVLADGRPAEALTPQVLAEAYGIEARVVAGAGGPVVEIVGRRG